MLNLIPFSDTTDKKRMLQGFNPDNSLWVITDVKSQTSILNELHKNNTSVKESCVIRATDLWTHMLSTTCPEKSIVNRPFLTFVYHEWAKSRKQEWEKTKETGNLICQYIEVLAHLLQHPLRDNLIAEWKNSTENKKETYWTIWYNLASEFWSYLSQKQIIEASWASALLLDHIPFEYFKSKEVIFDLGFEINKVEVELIRQISTKIKTTVLVPTCFNKKNQNYPHNIYDDFYEEEKPSLIKHSQPHIHSIQIKKFATPLAEIKDISYHVKHSLNKGIQPNKIYILVPHIEDYWTCLKSYLKKENIPVNKRETAFLHSFPVIQLWLAKMRTHLSIINYENLEIIQSHQNQYTNFSQLKAELYNVKKIEDCPFELYKKDQLKDKEELISLPVFIQWATKLLPKNINNADVYSSIKNCLSKFPESDVVTHLQLKWESWLKILEWLIGKKEIEIHKGDTEGINCLSFNALGWVEPDFTYIAGLSEQNIKKEKHIIFSSLEAHSIMKDLGFFIKNELSNKMEQAVSCFTNQKHKELILSFSSTDFSGTPLNPSCLWLEKAIEHKKDISHFDTPNISVWDQQQRKSSVKEILMPHNVRQPESELIDQSIQQDIGNENNDAPFFQKRIKSLSPSSLNEYIKCPFIFAAKKLFYLWDGPERDIDIPPTEQGILVHKLFELLSLTKKNQLSDQEILKIIDKIKNDKTSKQIFKIHPIIWEKEKSYLLRKALKFLEQEKTKKSLFKNYQTVACEKKYQCYWNFKTKSLTNEGDILFTGKIDRIDSNNQFYQIIDYKNSLATGSTATSWETKENFQMALYMQVMESGLANLPALPVKSALYLSYKNFDYQGLAIKEPAYIKLLGGPKKRSLVSEEKKESITEGVNKKIDSLILSIHGGKFPAQPKTKQLCIKCKWRKICRASHLN